MNMMNEPTPLQWALPRSLEVPPDQLQLRLDFFQDTIVMYQIEEGVTTSRPVSSVDIAAALTREITFSSGLLPENALWWSRGKDGDRIALWRKPQLTRVAINLRAFEAPERFHIPMPGLIFLCQSRRAPYVYATKRRPRTPEEPVYNCPTYNVFSTGLVCPGTHDFPEDITLIPESFFQSLFSETGDTGDRTRSKLPLLEHWRSLEGRKRYPLDDLVHFGTVESLQGGSN